MAHGLETQPQDAELGKRPIDLSRGSRTRDAVHGTRGAAHGIRDAAHVTRDAAHGLGTRPRDSGHGPCDSGCSSCDLGRSPWESGRGPWNSGRGPGTRDATHGTLDAAPGLRMCPRDLGCGPRSQNAAPGVGMRPRRPSGLVPICCISRTVIDTDMCLVSKYSEHATLYSTSIHLWRLKSMHFELF